MSAADAYLSALEPGQTALTWSGPSQPWSDVQHDGLVRAIAQDLQAIWGTPGAVLEQALFLLAAHFHDQHPVATGKAKATVAWTVGEETLTLRLERLRPNRVPPIPVIGGAGARALEDRPMSRLVASVARAPAAVVLEQDPTLPARLRTGLAPAYPTLEGRAAFQAAGACLALWQALQATEVVVGGALFRRLRHPDAPADSEGHVRLGFERRTPNHDAILSAAIDGGAFLLNL